MTLKKTKHNWMLLNAGFRGLLVACACVATVACGGSGARSSNDVKQTSLDNSGGATGVQNSSPSLSLSASSSSLNPGDTVQITWESDQTDTCTASGAWTGGKATQGSQIVGPIQQDSNFALSCSGTAGGVMQEVFVRVTTDSVLRLTFDTDKTTLREGESATLTWTATNADQCTASGDWDGSRPTSGSFTVASLPQGGQYGLSCSSASDTVLHYVNIGIFSGDIAWVPPTRNMDNTPINNLIGYKLYWDMADTRGFSNSIQFDRDTRRYNIDHFASGTYKFAVSSLDGEGNESLRSVTLERIVP